ncbi:MAG: hypothetical protein NTX42_08590 [Methanothrix sp.]|nr:hypothetical protein [Methanothrix sp.]
MTDRAKELEIAAKDIDLESLQAAKDAVAASCAEYIRWADLFSCRLGTVKPEELHKFARAFSLTLLGHLPTRPGTCPFCIQYDRDRACTGCGYAATHGRCDAEDSAFSLFIEAFQELGRSVYQDTGKLCCSHHDARMHLNQSIKVSRDLAMRLQEDLPSAGAQRLMELKAAYLDTMIWLLPVLLLSEEVRERSLLVRRMLLNYW